jgi:hypothetical protein
MKLTKRLALGQVAFNVQFIGRNQVVLTAFWVNPGKRMLRNQLAKPDSFESPRKNWVFLANWRQKPLTGNFCRSLPDWIDRT